MQANWEKMAALTSRICERGEDECSKFKDRPFRCCDRKYCEMAQEFAKAKGIDLQATGNPELPYMSDSGCIVPPHLRPICTIHVCTVSWAAKSHIEHSEEKTREYFRLRNELDW